MSVEQKDLDSLYAKIAELQLDLHAARVAITVLSSCVSSLTGDRQVLVNSVREGLDSNDDFEFDHPVDSDYREKLKERILQLL